MSGPKRRQLGAELGHKGSSCQHLFDSDAHDRNYRSGCWIPGSRCFGSGILQILGLSGALTLVAQSLHSEELQRRVKLLNGDEVWKEPSKPRSLFRVAYNARQWSKHGPKDGAPEFCQSFTTVMMRKSSTMTIRLKIAQKPYMMRSLGPKNHEI